MNFKIDKKSWHYRLVSYYGNHDNWNLDPRDFCSYFWRAMKGFSLICLGFIVAFFTIIGPFTNLLMWAIVSIKYRTDLPLDEPAKIAILLFVLFVAMVAIIFFINHRYSKRKDPTPTFSGMVYEKFKNKICVKIQYKN